MKDGLLLFILLCSISGCGSGNSDKHERTLADTALELTDASDLVIVKPVRDLGTIEAGKTTVMFEISNSGQNPIKINRVEKSCGCISARLDNSNLAPLGNTFLEVDFVGEPGDQESVSVTLHMDGAGNHRARISLSWNVNNDVSVSPPELDFGVIRPDSTVTKDVVIKIPVKRIDDAESPFNYFWGAKSQLSIEQEPHRIENGLIHQTLHITLSADENSTERNTFVDLPQQAKKPPIVRLPVKWNVRKVVECMPPNLFLGAGEVGSSFNGRVRVQTDPGTALEINDLSWQEKFPNADISFHIIDQYTIDILVKGDFSEDYIGKLQRTLQITCAKPHGEIIKIPVSAIVRAK